MNNRERRITKIPSIAPVFQTIETNWKVTIPGTAREPMSSSSMSLQRSPLSHFKLKMPLIARSDAIFDALELNSLPVDLYGVLARYVHHLGGALVATVDDLATVPLREIPIRIAPINSHSMPNVDALMSADAIELQLGDWTRTSSTADSKASLHTLRMDWPLDTPDLARLAKKIELIRGFTQSSVPVGVAVPVGDSSEVGIRSLQWLASMGVDFVTIRSATACLGKHHPARNYFLCDPIELTQDIHDLLRHSGKNPVAIAMDHPWQDGYQAAQAVRAGATFVGIDGYLAKFIPALSELMTLSVTDSLVSGIHGRSSTQSVPSKSPSISRQFEKLDLNAALSRFVEQFRSALEYSL